MKKWTSACKVLESRITVSAMLVAILSTVSLAANPDWQLNTQNPTDPLVFVASNGATVHPTYHMGPVFLKVDGSTTIGPDTYTAIVTNVSVVDGYTVLSCQATASGFSARYKLKFKKVAPTTPSDPNGMEIIINADPENPGDPGYVATSAFYPGILKANGIKQFYTGERLIEAWPGNYGDSPVLYWSSGNTYFYGFSDNYYTNASDAGLLLNPKTYYYLNNPVVARCMAYNAVSDGTRPVLKERYVLRASANMWNVYGPIINNSSEYRNELSQMMFFDDWSSDFLLGKYALNWLRGIVEDKLSFYTIVESWGNGGFDDVDPDAYRIPDHNTPHPQYGTKSELIDYVNFGKTVGRIGLRCNYMMATDASWSIQEGLVKRALDAAGTPQWFTNFHTVKPLVDRQEADIATDFATNAVHHDQWASGTVVNMDGTAPSKHNPLASAFDIYRQICASAKDIHQGPVSSESLFVEDLLGEYVDTGDFGIMDGNSRFTFSPEYKLRRLHLLSTFHGMGIGSRFFSTASIEQGLTTYLTDDNALDSYRACEVLYGNGAYLFYVASDRHSLRKIHALTECFTIGVAQRYYALQQLDYVQYGYNGQWKSFDEIIKSSSTLSSVQNWLKKFHIRYANGCHIWVNRDASNVVVTLPGGSSLTLPQNSWAVYTEDGQLIAYTGLSGTGDPDSGKRVDFCEDKNRGIKYVNPRTASSYKGVSKPTVWFNGQVHFVLDDSAETFVEAYLKEQFRPIPGVHIGDILSYFSSGETQVWGLDATGTGDNTLHVLTVNGQVYKYDVDSVKALTNGTQGVYNSKTRMMDSTTNITMRGLALLPTYESPGLVYVAVQDNRAEYRCIWGNPGSMTWAMIGGAFQLYMDSDITPASRNIDNPDIWCTYGNKIYRYQYSTWISPDSYTVSFTMPKALHGVSIGSNNDLWVLCQDREILHISSSNGTIIDRFYLPGSITQPRGIAYDRKGAIWITNGANNKIYQIACATGPVCGDVNYPYPTGDLNQDCYVNWADLSVFALHWLDSGCGEPDWCGTTDIDHNTKVNLADISVFAAHWMECTNPESPCNYNP